MEPVTSRDRSAVAVSDLALENSTKIMEYPSALAEMEIALLTGSQDRHYAFGLATALISKGVSLDFVGGDEVDSPEMHAEPKLHFLNLRRKQPRGANRIRKVSSVLMYYARLIRYAAAARPRLFHILWNNKFESFDRTLLTLYYKLLGKKIVFTAHNVNAAKRDSIDTPLNRFTLKTQYRLSDHIFVHTEKMKQELCGEFGVREPKVTVIPYGINNAIPDTSLTREEARRRLGISAREKTILFFGAIAPYKGLDLLVDAFQRITSEEAGYRLIIAGQPKGGCDGYLADVQQMIHRTALADRVIQKIEYIPDDAVDLYFKAADVLVLPYREIFQSGILFMSYSFGLPVVAADVGSFRDDVLQDRTGFICRPSDAADLADAIRKYFSSELFQHLDDRRQEIRDYVSSRHSWNVVGEMTRTVYADLLRNHKVCR